MSSIITVRNIDSGDKSWLQQEAKDQGVSMEEIVRRLIREKRQKAQTREKPSEVFRRYFGPEHGVELPPRGKYGYRPVEFQDSDEA
jgi:plasmid stability protein